MFCLLYVCVWQCVDVDVFFVYGLCYWWCVGCVVVLLLVVSVVVCDVMLVLDWFFDFDVIYVMQEWFGFGDVMVFFGFCIGVKNLMYFGQVVCIMVICLNGYGLEMQVDFYWNGEKWVVEFIVLQDFLFYFDLWFVEWVK